MINNSNMFRRKLKKIDIRFYDITSQNGTETTSLNNIKINLKGISAKNINNINMTEIKQIVNNAYDNDEKYKIRFNKYISIELHGEGTEENTFTYVPKDNKDYHEILITPKNLLNDDTPVKLDFVIPNAVLDENNRIIDILENIKFVNS